MADKTKIDLAKAVLGDVLGVIDAVEEPTAEDDAQVDRVYEDLLETLRDRGIAYWDANAIPQVVFRPLADYVALFARPAYGFPQSSREERIVAEAELRKVVAVKHANEPVRAVYF